MLYRSLAILIVIFWLTMIGLLVRKEVGPAGSALRAVPVEHVVKLLLVHSEESDLSIYREKLRLGRLRIHPHMHKLDRSRVIDFLGHLQIMIPGLERQRVEWKGEIELEKTLKVRRFSMDFAFREPGARETLAYAQIIVSPADNLLTWTWLDQTRTYTLDDAGLQSALREIVDASVLEMFQQQTKGITPPVIKALQSSMTIHGERIDTYLVTIEQSGQTILAIDVSQIGTILRVKTLPGYSLAPDDLVP